MTAATEVPERQEHCARNRGRRKDTKLNDLILEGGHLEVYGMLATVTCTGFGVALASQQIAPQRLCYEPSIQNTRRQKSTKI